MRYLNTRQFGFFIAAALTLVACGSAAIGGVSPSPEVTVFEHQLEEPLHLFINQKITNEQVMKSEGLKDVDLKQYRESLQASLRAGLASGFQTIHVEDSHKETGLVLRLKHASPKHVRAQSVGGASDANGEGGFAIEIDYAAALEQGGVEIKAAHGYVISDKFFATVHDGAPALERALALMTEEIMLEIFNPDILAKIGGKHLSAQSAEQGAEGAGEVPVGNPGSR